MQSITNELSIQNSHEECSLCHLKQNKEKNEVIEINGNKNSMTITIAAERFPCIREKIFALSNKNHLPKLTSLTMKRGKSYCPNLDNLLRLCFLSTIIEKSDKIPVTNAEHIIFKESRNANTKTRRWLGRAGITTYALLAASSGAINFLGYAQIARVTNETATNGTASHSDSINKAFTTTLICASAIGLGVLTNWAGIWWTGRNPDVSSIKANLQQNRIRLLQHEYLNLAFELINLYCNERDRLLAKEMSKEINVRLIEKILNEKTYDKDASELIGLVDLEAVIEYIKSEGQLLPQNAILRSHIACAEKGIFI
ncbi:MAG: hypothetical protein H0T62_05125 [Parachlamydiaceae bacterium]|nr:hypothetical protein [Parachlamydiaceae bacterium]